MSSSDMLIGVNMARVAANARMADANEAIDDIADQRDDALEQNRRLAAKLRQLEDRLADERFQKNMAAMRTKELAAEVRKLDPKSPVVDPALGKDRNRQKAQELLSDPSFGFAGYVYDVDRDELRRA
jgi:chromosome segregation ATPase